MRRILLDQNAPRGWRLMLPGHDVQSAYQLGWGELSNGELLRAAERAAFEIVITCDQNIKYQKDLTGDRLAVVVLDTTHWPTIDANPQPVREAVERATRGSYVVVTFPRPRLRRRPPPGGGVA